MPTRCRSGAPDINRSIPRRLLIAFARVRPLPGATDCRPPAAGGRPRTPETRRAAGKPELGDPPPSVFTTTKDLMAASRQFLVAIDSRGVGGVGLLADPLFRTYLEQSIARLNSSAAYGRSKVSGTESATTRRSSTSRSRTRSSRFRCYTRTVSKSPGGSRPMPKHGSRGAAAWSPCWLSGPPARSGRTHRITRDA